jgi:hypothetical protein
MMRLYCSVLLTILAVTIPPFSSESVGYNPPAVRTVNITAKKRGPVMLSRGEVAMIRAEIERLEKALKECTDGGIRDRIKAWIEEEEKKLLAGEIQSSPRKPARKSDDTGKSLR